MPIELLLGKPPRLTRDVVSVPAQRRPFDGTTVALRDAAYRVLRLPAVADKTFLITIGDRTVGGLISRDQMVGPWQVPFPAIALNGFAGPIDVKIDADASTWRATPGLRGQMLLTYSMDEGRTWVPSSNFTFQG